MLFEAMDWLEGRTYCPTFALETGDSEGRSAGIETGGVMFKSIYFSNL